MSKRAKRTTSAKPVRDWSIEQIGRSIHRIKANASASNPFWMLVRSDAHHDSTHCDREMERRHLEQAAERGAAVVDIGDLFDAMQGRNDPRRATGGKRSDIAERAYFDAITDDAVDFYAPFAHCIALIGIGNHESKIEQHNDIDLTANLTARLTERTGHKVCKGGYGGWVILELQYRSAPGECSGKRIPYKIRYHHGSGKGAMMTFGALDSRRMASWLTNADMVLTGHTHDHMTVPIARETIYGVNGRWEHRRDEMLFIRCGTYKDEHGDGHSGFAVEKNIGPKPSGAVWLKFTVHRERVGPRERLSVRCVTERAT